MKKLMLCALAIVAAGSLAMGCSKGSSDAQTATNANDAAKQADQMLGGGNCVQALQTWGQLFTPLQSGGVSDDAKAKIKQQIADLKGKVPANVGSAMDTMSAGIDKAKSPTDVATFLSSPEFTKANTDVTNYFTTECSKVGK